MSHPRIATVEPTAANDPARLVHFAAGGVSLVIDCRGTGLPQVVHWGADLGGLDTAKLAGLAVATAPPVARNGLGESKRVSLLPEHGDGWLGLPGLRGHRAQGRDWSPLFETTGLTVEGGAHRPGRLAVTAIDRTAALSLRLRVEMSAAGLIRLDAAVRNDHRDGVYELDGLSLALPVPPEATELLDLAGRWAHERSPQRQSFGVGARVRDNRRGRTGADATLLLVAGTPGFGFRAGRAWGLHVAWSGNHRTLAERLSSGETVLAGGELLLPGEVTLQPGEEYVSPALFASYGQGLDQVSERFHRHLRSRRRHRDHPRPVVINTWEAVYFDHDLDRLKRLAECGARVGAERFVLDDGWFRGRRSEEAGLGDWYVDPDIWPDGLHPLVDHVRGLGMQFGLWVEPEMISLDSDLARAHPEWILATGGRIPPPARFQQVVNVACPDAFAYLLERLNALIDEYRLDYLKWDHNRDLVDAGHQPLGSPAVHAQTLAVYRLLDRLRDAHPDLEVESCAGGGGRIDLGILERTDRVWGSDNIDAHERQFIQRWTALLLPPELIGAHVGSPRSHTTGRILDLAFRAGTALFGDFGIEWDLTTAGDEDLAALADWVDVYKRHRSLLHTGRVVRNDPGDGGLWLHGVIGPDASEAIIAVVAVATAAMSPVDRITIPGLAPDLTYRVEPLPPGDELTSHWRPPWITAGGVTVTGRTLAEVGLQPPLLQPDQLLLLRLTASQRSS